jgi:cobalt-zinc-cadmium resistance protein CzcA
MAMLIAFILMHQVGLSANLMSLAGLAIGIGMMVDGAVVMVENGYRLLSHRGPKVESRSAVIFEAAREVANPMAFAILIIIVVFLPLFSLTDLEGKLFKPMALAITFAMLGSLFLTLTLVPVLSALLLRPKPERDTLIVRLAKRAYLPLLERALARKRLTLGSRPGSWSGRWRCSRSSARSSCPTCRKACCSSVSRASHRRRWTNRFACRRRSTRC